MNNFLPKRGPRQRRGFDPRILLSLLPLVAFWLGYQWGGTYPAIAGGLIGTVAAYLLSNRHGLVGLFALIALVITAGAALVGVLIENERAFLARDATTDFLIAAIALISLLVKRPVVGLILQSIYRPLRELMPLNHRAFVWSTLIVAGVNIVQGIVRTWMLYADFTVGQYLVFSRLFGWPLAIAMLIAISIIVRRAVKEAQSKV